jgi:serine/threonine-protein kinase
VSAQYLGPYRLDAVLGHSPTGEVHRAVDTRWGREVALKVLSPRHASDPQTRARFEHEARAMARVRSPHVLPVHDFGRMEGRPFIEMPLAAARTLRALMDDRGPFDLPSAVAVVEQVAAALDATHAAGIVHRDVKPENVLVTPSGRSYLIDFGLARSGEATWSTDPDVVVGTMPYLAPERLTGRGDHRVDVYALACLLFELLTGRQPFPAADLVTLARSHRSAPPPRASLARRDVGRALDEVLRRGMAEDPDARYQRAGAFAAAVHRVTAIEPRGAAWTSRGELVPRPRPALDDDDDDGRAPSGPVAEFLTGAAAVVLVLSVLVLLAALVVVATASPGG